MVTAQACPSESAWEESSPPQTLSVKTPQHCRRGKFCTRTGQGDATCYRSKANKLVPEWQWNPKRGGQTMLHQSAQRPVKARLQPHLVVPSILEHGKLGVNVRTRQYIHYGGWPCSPTPTPLEHSFLTTFDCQNLQLFV